MLYNKFYSSNLNTNALNNLRQKSLVNKVPDCSQYKKIIVVPIHLQDYPDLRSSQKNTKDYGLLVSAVETFCIYLHGARVPTLTELQVQAKGKCKQELRL